MRHNCCEKYNLLFSLLSEWAGVDNCRKECILTAPTGWKHWEKTSVTSINLKLLPFVVTSFKGDRQIEKHRECNQTDEARMRPKIDAPVKEDTDIEKMDRFFLFRHFLPFLRSSETNVCGIKQKSCHYRISLKKANF